MNYNFIKDLLYECIVYNEEEYLDIGMTLKSIGQDNYKHLWIEWCIFNSNHNSNEIEKKWLLFSKNKNENGIKHIIIIAKKYNNIKYKEIKYKNAMCLIDNCIDKGGDEYEVAKFISLYTYDKYKSLTKKDETSLNIKLSEKFSKKFTNYIKFNMKQITDDNSDEIYKFNHLLNKFMIASKIALKLKNNNYKTKIIREIKLI